MRPIAVVCGVLGLAAAWMLTRRFAPDILETSATPAATSFVDHRSSEWVEELSHGARIEVFRSEKDALGGVVKPASAIQSIGKLELEDVARLRRSVSPESNTAAVLKAQSKAERSGRHADYARFLLELAATEKFRAAAAMIDKGDYLLLPPGTELPPLPDDYLLLQVLGFRRQVPSEPCDVGFLIPLKEFPALDQAWKAYTECQKSVYDDEARQFNEMSLEARVAAIAAHDAARAEVGKAEDKLSENLNAARRAIIDGRFVIDRATNTIWVREMNYR